MAQNRLSTATLTRILCKWFTRRMLPQSAGLNHRIGSASPPQRGPTPNPHLNGRLSARAFRKRRHREAVHVIPEGKPVLGLGPGIGKASLCMR